MLRILGRTSCAGHAHQVADAADPKCFLPRTCSTRRQHAAKSASAPAQSSAHSTSRCVFGTARRRLLAPLPAAAVAADLHTLIDREPPRYTLAQDLVSSAAAASGLGVTQHDDGSGEATVRVWAPHAETVSLLLQDRQVEVPLSRNGDDWAVCLTSGTLEHGTAYALLLTMADGRRLERRDPYARSADYGSNWCYVDDPTEFEWSEWTPRAFDENIIYEMHVGSFTPEDTFAAAMAKLDHVAATGYTAIQLMPITEHSDAWGYNPRQLMAVHGVFGSPDDLRRLVDRAHVLGMNVIMDVVLHHGAVEGNTLWNYDGWGPDNNGGIYHEHAPDTEWGRAFAFWKSEVRAMVYAACASWLSNFHCDGLRFDSANDLPSDACQALTWSLRESFPGRLLAAEVTPENPMSVRELGFDSVWVHSGYFDIIQQHRALGRGHHGGGDWANGWDLPRLRTVMTLHFGFESPTQCIKYLLGSHDQVGCRKGGAWYKDYEMIGGQHRYAVDQFGGGRSDAMARASARLWYAANIAAAGIPMIFMGTEFAQGGWWDVTEHRRLQWSNAEDQIGKDMMAAFREANTLRSTYPALRSGWPNILHEDRPNGVVAFERVKEGETRIVTIINAGRQFWSSGEYGAWVGGGAFEQVYCSQDPAYGGWDKAVSNGGKVLQSHEGKLYISLPQQCTIIFKQVS